MTKLEMLLSIRDKAILAANFNSLSNKEKSLREIVSIADKLIKLEEHNG